MVPDGQETLFQEDVYDAMRHAVKALGGAKKVGTRLWPDKPMAQAETLLHHCLNPERNEKLDLYQITWILREANQRGCHVAIAKFCADARYEAPKPINLKRERDELRKQFVGAVKAAERFASLIQKLDDDEL